MCKDVDKLALNEFDYNYFGSKISFFTRMINKSKSHLIIIYEDLLANSEEVYKQIIDFSHLTYDPDIFQNALEKSSFENMRKLEMEQKGLKDRFTYKECQQSRRKN